MPKATKYNGLPCVEDYATDGSRLRPATSNMELRPLHNSMRINDTEATSTSLLRYTTSSGLHDSLPIPRPAVPRTTSDNYKGIGSLSNGHNNYSDAQHANSYSTNVANYRSVNESNDVGVPFQREIDM
jgi:hypothetical protein